MPPATPASPERHVCTECTLTISSPSHEVAAVTLLGDVDYFHTVCWTTKNKREETNKRTWFKGTGLYKGRG